MVNVDLAAQLAISVITSLVDSVPFEDASTELRENVWIRLFIPYILPFIVCFMQQVTDSWGQCWRHTLDVLWNDEKKAWEEGRRNEKGKEKTEKGQTLREGQENSRGSKRQTALPLVICPSHPESWGFSDVCSKVPTLLGTRNDDPGFSHSCWWTLSIISNIPPDSNPCSAMKEVKESRDGWVEN